MDDALPAAMPYALRWRSAALHGLGQSDQAADELARALRQAEALRAAPLISGIRDDLRRRGV